MVKNCPECGHGVSDAARTCPSCGHPIRKIWPTALAVGIVTVLLALLAAKWLSEHDGESLKWLKENTCLECGIGSGQVDLYPVSEFVSVVETDWSGEEFSYHEMLCKACWREAFGTIPCDWCEETDSKAIVDVRFSAHERIWEEEACSICVDEAILDRDDGKDILCAVCEGDCYGDYTLVEVSPSEDWRCKVWCEECSEAESDDYDWDDYDWDESLDGAYDESDDASEPEEALGSLFCPECERDDAKTIVKFLYSKERNEETYEWKTMESKACTDCIEEHLWHTLDTGVHCYQCKELVGGGLEYVNEDGEYEAWCEKCVDFWHEESISATPYVTE